MTRRTFTLEFKAEAVKLVKEQGYSHERAAQALGISSKNMNRWVRQLVGTNVVVTSLTPEQEEIKRLRKENERLKMEREILKKAAAFFANESN